MRKGKETFGKSRERVLGFLKEMDLLFKCLNINVQVLYL